MILPLRPMCPVILEDEDEAADLTNAHRFAERVPLHPDGPESTLFLTRAGVWVLETAGRYRRLAPVIARVWLTRNGYRVMPLPDGH